LKAEDQHCTSEVEDAAAEPSSFRCW